jgi:hypothetical protein
VTASRPGNLANLRKAAAARTAAATARTEAALDRMLRTGQPVTFRSLAAAASVSLDFLYRSPAIRQRVEQLRAQQACTAPADRSAPDARPDQPGNVVAALAGELAELKRRHREQVTELQRALQAAHGENLLLRRRLGSNSNPPAQISDTPPTPR